MMDRIGTVNFTNIKTPDVVIDAVKIKGKKGVFLKNRLTGRYFRATENQMMLSTTDYHDKGTAWTIKDDGNLKDEFGKTWLAKVFNLNTGELLATTFIDPTEVEKPDLKQEEQKVTIIDKKDPLWFNPDKARQEKDMKTWKEFNNETVKKISPYVAHMPVNNPHTELDPITGEKKNSSNSGEATSTNFSLAQIALYAGSVMLAFGLFDYFTRKKK